MLPALRCGALRYPRARHVGRSISMVVRGTAPMVPTAPNSNFESLHAADYLNALPRKTHCCSVSRLLYVAASLSPLCGREALGGDASRRYSALPIAVPGCSLGTSYPAYQNPVVEIWSRRGLEVVPRLVLSVCTVFRTCFQSQLLISFCSTHKSRLFFLAGIRS